MNGPSPPQLAQLRNVLRGTLFDGSLDALEAVHRGVRPADGSATARRPPSIRPRRGTRTPLAWWNLRAWPEWCARSRRSGRPPGIRGRWSPSSSMVSAALTSSTVIVPSARSDKPLGHLGGRVVVQLGQLVEDAARGLAGDDRPRRERDPLGRIPRRHVGIQRLGDGLLVEHLCGARQVGLRGRAAGPAGSVGGGGIGAWEGCSGCFSGSA